MRDIRRQWEGRGLAALAMALVLGLGSVAMAEPPASMEDFEKRLAEEATTPEGAIKLWFDGIFLMASEDAEQQALGTKMVQRLTKGYGDDWMTKRTSATFLERIKTQTFIFQSYAKGATPDNGYAFDLATYELNIVLSNQDTVDRDAWVIGLQSGGADKPRKLKLFKDARLQHWVMSSFSTAYQGVRKAAK